MHQVAEYGVAAHWRYKEGKTSDVDFEEKMSELRQLLEWQRDVTSTAEFIESVKQDILRDQVFVYTPKGRIVELTAGSTPVDFAYKIHTELGHRCVGAKVNGRLVSLDTAVQNGDTVEIMSTKSDRGPSLDLAQSQPRLCPFRPCPPEHPPMVQPAETRDQYPAGAGDTAPGDAPSQPEVRRR